ncbi:DUF1285 domain-containing protein [Thalassotalea agarivorans]|uniref:DUF1285 domain-containing protein n=1 Tax=Thalassotalea agarivorans TaxID=349064 RepID=A0A1I0CR12_THASX|nr:DUF1285 domain-containing protein [Thalassotalea agarivorans]SET22202.1 hypothetical protein SAMN05660429_01299 [Thalassotalea agarivorans]
MSLDKITQQLAEQSTTKYPPVHLWDPPYCGEIDIEIKSDGTWFYNGGEIKRLPLVKLFASVLKREQHDYFLVTPVEKVKIKVVEKPYVITQWEMINGVMQLTTQLGDVCWLEDAEQLEISEQGHIYITVRNNLQGLVHRNVYYQWIEMAEQKEVAGKTHLGFYSNQVFFDLGAID